MQEIKDSFGNFDLAMINYNPAGPYPSCFTNLSNNEKLKKRKRLFRET